MDKLLNENYQVTIYKKGKFEIKKVKPKWYTTEFYELYVFGSLEKQYEVCQINIDKWIAECDQKLRGGE